MRGVTIHHSRNCFEAEPDCSCAKRFIAWVWDPSAEKKVYRSFKSQAAAVMWRQLMVTYKQDVNPNPIAELRALAESHVAAQRERFGDALPHSQLALDYLKELEEAARRDIHLLWKVAA